MMTIITISDIKAELDYVDHKDALERAKKSPALRAALEMYRPRNWWGTGIPPERLLKIAKDEGIPVAWVPPTTLLIELDLAIDHDERLAILRKKQDEVLNHCETLLMECTDQWLADEQYLSVRVLEALRAGHYEAALALAVSVGEPLAVWASTSRVKTFGSEKEAEDRESYLENISKYRWARDELDDKLSATRGKDILRTALIAPILEFFKPFWPEKGDEIPKRLSRHAVVHTAKRNQFSPDNALLALMLVSSILYQMQLWCTEVRTMNSNV